MKVEDVNLGARSLYYHQACPSRLFHSIEECIKNNANPKIDPHAVLGILMKNYPISNRTLISDIKRTPWMNHKNLGQMKDQYLPPHKNLKLSGQNVAEELKFRLEDEALKFIQNKKTIGVLLSGGMDSRVIAGILKSLQLKGLFNGDIVALTWGKKDCRDVVYAKEVAKKLKWELCHFPLTPELMVENIKIAALRGAEYSPIHLHAMKEISEQNGIDGIIAGSYGDGIGRGEYSGVRADKLQHLLKKNLNMFSIMLTQQEHESLEVIKRDIENDRLRFPGRTETSYREIEMQMHYMARQLNACMEVIDDNIPVYQMFASSSVYGFMWSIDSSLRGNEHYTHLLEILPCDLLSIPWARTGKLYHPSSERAQDNLSSSNNEYGAWLRDDCSDYILSLINNGTLQSTGIFNNLSLNKLSKTWPTSTRNKKANRLDEKMSWLASLSLFLKTYNVEVGSFKYSLTTRDLLNFKKSQLLTYLYLKLTKEK